MPKARRSSSKKGHRTAPSGSPGPSYQPSEEETDKSRDEFYEKCTEAALWGLGKIVELSTLAYGATALCTVFAYGSALRGGKSLANLGTVAILLLPWAAVVSSGAVLVTKLGWTTLIFLAVSGTLVA